jgi:hypothetical protein
MPVDIEAFVSIEQSLTSRLTKTWTELSIQYYKELKVAVSQKDWDKAVDIAQRIDLTPIFTENKEFIRYATYAAMFFGASRLNDKLDTSIIGTGQYEEVVNTSVEFLGKSILQNVTTLVQDDILAELTEMQNADHEVQLIAKADGRILSPMVSFQITGDEMLQLIAQLHTSRLSGYGFTAEAEVLNIEEYQITEQLDNRICPICRIMHRKKFKVADARRSLETILHADNPDDLVNLQPWPDRSKQGVEDFSQLTNDQLVARNWHIPPYHPGCRGLLVKVGSAPKLVETPTHTTAVTNNYKVTLDTFDQLGIKIGDVNAMDIWNEYVGVAPGDVVAGFLGLTPAQMLKGLPDGVDAVMRDYFRIRANASLFGSSEKVELSFNYFPNTKEMDISLLELKKADQGRGILKEMMKNWIPMLERLEIEKISLDANISVGSYAWAKYGWVPTEGSWNQLKRRMLMKMDDVAASISPESTKVLLAAFSSPDPKAIWAITDLTETINGEKLGKYFLGGDYWKGALNMSDPQAVERFMMYLGS